jgi:TRAP-type C4-dicarboxylate transport system permease small subunit
VPIEGGHRTRSDAAAVTAYIRVVTALSRFFGVVAALLIATAIVVVMHMIFERGALGKAVIWQTEFVTYSIVAATFLGSPYVLLTRGHVSVDVVPLLLGQRARVALALAGSGLAVVFCLVILWYSFAWWWDAFSIGEVKNSIWAPKLWVPYLSLPIGFGLLIAQYAADMWCVATGRALPFGLKPKPDRSGA